MAAEGTIQRPDETGRPMTMVLIDASRHGREPPADELRKRGLEGLGEILPRLADGDSSVELAARSCLRDLVDAFLADREANRDLFSLAHTLGGLISATAECFWQPGEEVYSLNCPVYALHRPFAHSIAVTVTTTCSICGAGAFRCLHLPGNFYEGELCVNEVTGIGPVGHIALTAKPDFIYTWHQPLEQPVEDLIKRQIIKRPGDKATCTHCLECGGEPTADDLDPVTRFERMVEEGLAREQERPA